MVEVDLRLFVTCRLCLDVQGHFQIDHTVKEQFKYCFDIDVEPFDGLPQLICKNCENILKEYYAIKKKFTEKQKELKTRQHENARKIVKSPSPQRDESNKCNKKTKLDNVPSSSRLDNSDSSTLKHDYDEKNTRKKKKVKKNRIIKRFLSSSEDDLDSNDLSETQKNTSPKEHSYNEDKLSWNANFNKYFVCRICSEGFQDKEGVTNHINKHNSLQMKYKNVFKMSCLVVMEKSDNKPNMCNNNDVVVYSSDSVIQNTHNPFYYTKYHPKMYSNITTNFKYISKNNVSSAESSDSDLTCKRRRLSSRGSSETVVLNRQSEHEDTSRITENDKKPPTVIECIDLGDSSDNGSYESNEKSRTSNNKGNLESKPMHNIIKMCLNKYNKQTDSRERNKVKENFKVKDLLQHKVLSIGRKIINNNGFNCTGLLRFLEYKDLSVIWKETSVLKPNDDGKYVRIATRVRGNESSDPKKAGWKNLNLVKFENNNFKSINILKKLKALRNFKKLDENSKNKDNLNSAENLPRFSSIFSHSDLEISKVESDNLLLTKLLNKNPVSNPKQLPKKSKSNDSFKVFSAPNTVPVIVQQSQETNDTDALSMPIVTSTVSLANLCEKTENVPIEESVPKPTNQQSAYPRIKVKPVSELMPEKPTTNTNSTETYVIEAQNSSQFSGVVWSNHNTSLDKQQPSSGQTIPVIIGNPQLWPNQNNTYMQHQTWPNQNLHLSGQHKTVDKVSKTSRIPDPVILKEYMVLDTVEFPNTKTSSPFQYFKNLLLVHNINLLNPDEPLPTGSVSLVKLKLVYQQEKCEAITLCSSLFCIQNTFSIQIKDLNNKNMDVYNLSANWQWQLLKIYNEEVITRVLQTALKVGSQTFKYTQQFFSLLRSIKPKTIQCDLESIRSSLYS